MIRLPAHSMITSRLFKLFAMNKNELKYYSSLLKKKHRDAENKFLVEGIKTVSEGLKSRYECEIIFATHIFYKENENFLQELDIRKDKIELLKNPDFAKLTDTVTPQGIAAVFIKPEVKAFSTVGKEKIIACLENISDPGNVGTIIRNCDWFGITNIFLSEGCADVYNPKTIRASMGSLFHVNVYPDSNPSSVLLELKKDHYKILCADLDGKDIFNVEAENKTVIAFANEASGPSPELLNIADAKVTIPKFGQAESLNVASASAVILAQLCQHYKS